MKSWKAESLPLSPWQRSGPDWFSCCRWSEIHEETERAQRKRRDRRAQSEPPFFHRSGQLWDHAGVSGGVRSQRHCACANDIWNYKDWIQQDSSIPLYNADRSLVICINFCNFMFCETEKRWMRSFIPDEYLSSRNVGLRPRRKTASIILKF